MAATQGSGYLYFVSLLLTLVAVVTATSEFRVTPNKEPGSVLIHWDQNTQQVNLNKNNITITTLKICFFPTKNPSENKCTEEKEILSMSARNWNIRNLLGGTSYTFLVSIRLHNNYVITYPEVNYKVTSGRPQRPQAADRKVTGTKVILTWKLNNRNNTAVLRFWEKDAKLQDFETAPGIQSYRMNLSAGSQYKVEIVEKNSYGESEPAVLEFKADPVVTNETSNFWAYEKWPHITWLCIAVSVICVCVIVSTIVCVARKRKGKKDSQSNGLYSTAPPTRESVRQMNGESRVGLVQYSQSNTMTTQMALSQSSCTLDSRRSTCNYDNDFQGRKGSNPYTRDPTAGDLYENCRRDVQMPSGNISDQSSAKVSYLQIHGGDFEDSPRATPNLKRTPSKRNPYIPIEHHGSVRLFAGTQPANYDEDPDAGVYENTLVKGGVIR